MPAFARSEHTEDYVIEGLVDNDWVLYCRTKDYGLAVKYWDEAIRISRYEQVRLVRERTIRTLVEMFKK